jgi:hypothetical protein
MPFKSNLINVTATGKSRLLDLTNTWWKTKAFKCKTTKKLHF